MGLALRAERLPLVEGADGAVRVVGTRVTLDALITAFVQGATAEEIVQQYSTVPLADAYAVIAYYLRHRSSVDSYLARRSATAADVQRTNESRCDPAGIRARLLARRPGEWEGQVLYLPLR